MLAPSPLTITLESGGQITQIKDWSISSDYFVSTDGWEATIIDARFRPADLLLEPVTLSVGGVVQCVGRVDIVESGRDLSIRLQGRDYFADLVECNTDPAVKLTDGMTLPNALLELAGPVGISEVVADTDVAVRDLRSGLTSTKSRGKARSALSKSLKDISPQPGEGIYESCDRICKRFGVTMQPGDRRDQIILSRPLYEQPAAYRIVKSPEIPVGQGNAVIVESTANRDYSSMPTYCLFHGQQGKSGERVSGTKREFSPAEVLELVNDEVARVLRKTASDRRRSPARASYLRSLYRLLTYRDDKARTQEQLDNATVRAFSERFKDTLQYSATLRGHVSPQTGAVYSVDTVIDVDDAVADVHELLWIKSRTLRYSEGQGATTEVECIRPGSYIISAE